MTRLLSRKDVVRLLDMGETIEIMAKAFADLAEGRALMPQRTPVPVPEHAGVALFMPAFLKGMGALGAKTVTVYKENPAKYKLPTILGTLLLLDERTGVPLALMDAGFLTAMRTGAVAGLATRLLARAESRVHVVFGTGGMARAQVWAVDCVRNIERLVLFSLDAREQRQAFADSLRDIVSCEIVVAEDAASAVREADIVTLITSAKDPIVDGTWFKPGTHINGIGAHAPAMRELDGVTVQRSKVVCDLLEACQAEAGDFIIPAQQGVWGWDQVHASLGDIVVGRAVGRTSAEEITLFKSVGLAIQDVSTAQHVYRKAQRLDVGIEFDFNM